MSDHGRTQLDPVRSFLAGRHGTSIGQTGDGRAAGHVKTRVTATAALARLTFIL
jgi:hypothetical protein